MPTRRGWCTFQNSSASASQSGTSGSWPQGNRFSSSAATSEPQMKNGFAGRSR